MTAVRQRRRPLWLVGLAAFVLFIVYATCDSAVRPDPAELALRDAAEQVCREAVGARTNVAGYPFASRVQPEPAVGYKVEGTVDTGSGDGPLARYNYECLVSGAGGATMTVDSLALWQSH